MSPLLAHLTGADGLVDGLFHPVFGLDHLAAMALVGVLAFVLRDRLEWWAVPAAFIAAMVVGGVAGIAGLPAPGWVEVAIAASVVGLAAAVLAAGRLGTAAVPAVALVGLAHGTAHGAEVPAASTPALYVVGFVLATAAIHLAGGGLGRLVGSRPGGRAAIGAAAAGAGVLLLAS